MYAYLQPTGDDIGNSQIQDIAIIAGWAVGPAFALLSWVLVMALNGVRRLLRLRKIAWLHPVIAILGLLPWLLLGWQLTMNEPRYTPFARAVIDFAGKEMLVGAFVACVFAVACSVPLLFRTKQ